MIDIGTRVTNEICSPIHFFFSSIKRSFVYLFEIKKTKQVFERQEMAASQKTSSGIGEETRLARILGLSERDDAAVLSVRFPRGTPRRGCAQASHHRRRCHHAAHTRTSPTRLHLLSQHCVRRCLSFSGTHFSLVF